MSPRWNPQHDFYEVKDEIVERWRKDDGVELEIATLSTASDLPGPGRTFGNVVDALGRAVQVNFMSAQRHPPRNLYEVDRETLERWRRDDGVALELASLSTASNLPGHGRTLGNIVGMFGRAFEHACAAVGTKLGLGPHAAMARLLKPALRSCLRGCFWASSGWHTLESCEMCSSFQRSLDYIKRREPDISMLLDAMITATVFTGKNPSTNISRRIKQVSRKVIEYNGRNYSSSQNTMIYYSIVLKAFIHTTVCISQTEENRLRHVTSELSQIIGNDDPFLFGRSGSALVSELQTGALNAIKEYDCYFSLFADYPVRYTTNNSLLWTFMSGLMDQSLCGNVDVSYPVSIAIMRTFSDPIDVYLLLTQDYFANGIHPSQIARWLKIVVTTSDPLLKLIGVRLINTLFQCISDTQMDHPVLFEIYWLPLSVVALDIAESLEGEESNVRALGGHFRLELPLSLSHNAESRIQERTSQGLRLLCGGPSSERLEELHSPVFQILARFICEWYAGAAPQAEGYSLGLVPHAVDYQHLRHLCSRLIHIYIRSPCIPDIIEIITRKDRDSCDTILDILSEHLSLSTSADDHERLRHCFSQLSTAFALRSVVKIPLHDRRFLHELDRSFPGLHCVREKRWIDADLRLCPHKGQVESLIGDYKSLRWICPTESSDRWKPILAGRDVLGGPLYVGCFFDERARRSKAYVLLNEVELRDKDRLERYQHQRLDYGARLYILAWRSLSARQRDEAPHIYWASPEWNYDLCLCSDRHPSHRSGRIHIPEPIPDFRLTNAVTLEETVIKGGDTKEVYVSNW
ncbi:hypothetical protein NEOLEDRAFT_1182489 [Neolentinus lepideus HHB14362 ss-1]|uniref:Uncharacterized protein n=1 Tax=Neolentinus lepideus HHB14362 ss-1 TaxID=1314782 RepID=A0A165P512_9AGAM|nr:hypothetical protein NEOLEDRAFT_1182489 [Neolentinus lepideus HHB14362 ss-1]